MSTSRRAYDLLRAYVNQEWERISVNKSGTPIDASAELQDALDRPWTVAKPPKPDKDPLSLPGLSTSADPIGRSRHILGVTEADDFAKVHSRYQSLMKRSSPEKFPDGSEEKFRAEQIRRLVVEAYRVLSESVSDTERRFGSLELE